MKKLSPISTVLLLLISSELGAQIPDGALHRQTSRLSNFDFTLFNSGLLFGDTFDDVNWRYNGYAPYVANWPRGFDQIGPIGTPQGLAFLGIKNGVYSLAHTSMLTVKFSISFGPFHGMVPGRVGDAKAGYDPVYNGKGWKYFDNPDYIVYSSLDYNSDGVDISGNNYNDWPIRLVNGAERYIDNPLERSRYRPIYRSDEDMITVFKDTDTRAYWPGDEPITKRDPIGIEIHQYVYSWGSGTGKDIVLFRYEVINKSGSPLDSCHIIFSPGIQYSFPSQIGGLRDFVHHKFSVYKEEPARRLVYLEPADSIEWIRYWKATPHPPLLGNDIIETPRGYDGTPLGTGYAVTADQLLFRSMTPANVPSGVVGHYIFDTTYSPVDLFHKLIHPIILDSLGNSYFAKYYSSFLMVGPFPMQPNDTARFVVGYLFANDAKQLVLMDDYVKRMYALNLQRPSPPPSPKVVVKPLDRGVFLKWDNSAESFHDAIVPDSLRIPFAGYKLLRSQTEKGPFLEIKRWTKDSVAYEYLDRGKEIGGLKNNVKYYYHLIAFDGGAPSIKLDTMESKPIDGVNSTAVVPGTEPSNAISNISGGTVISGTPGDITGIVLVPLSTTIFNNIFSGRTLQVSLGAATDGTRYLMPATVKDSVGGRIHNAVIDPDIFVHGSPSVAGVKDRDGVIRDLFGLKGANLLVHYRFEQLSEPYHITSTIETGHGADVPIIVSDSLKVTGITAYSPYSSASKEIIITFTTGGVDTMSQLFQRYIPYLNVTLTDAATGVVLQSDVDYKFIPLPIQRAKGLFYTAKRNRYYLTGVLSNGEQWDVGHVLTMYNSYLGFDFPDCGQGSGKTGLTFAWGSGHKAGTNDFQTGDRVHLKWSGGVKATFPYAAVFQVTGAAGGRLETTSDLMENIRIVPNPYMARHEAERGSPRIYFNYLPEECTIRIYTVALDLVKTIRHIAGSREEWDLQTEGGQLVASQILIAHIEASNGAKTVKKFGVVLER